ncbi:MAG: hypothetical protein Q9225_002731 [Loekoesia sp. 1 TL-2023]
MQQVMMGRKRSLRSRRQPDTEQKSPTGTPAEPDRVHSGSNIPSHMLLDQRSTQPHRHTPPTIQVEQQKSPIYNCTSYPFQPPVDSQPPEMMIGVALGSPGESPIPPFSPDEGRSWTSRSPDPPSHASPHCNDINPLRPKGHRWKALGGLFGKRSSSSQPPTVSSLYQLHQPDNSVQISGSPRKLQRPQPLSAQIKSQDSKGASVQNGFSRDWIGPEQLPSPRNGKESDFRRKTSLRRHNFARKQGKDSKKNEALETNHIKRHPDGDRVISKDGMASGNVFQEKSHSGSLLQVEIPNVELERYSVMFSSLLHPSQQSNSSRQTSPNRQPSLLARRKANLQELHTAPKADFEPPWMHGELCLGNRAVSPNKSPSFSLFPPSPTAGGRKNHGAARERSPLQRTATAPSPSKAKFDFSSTAEQQDQVIVIVHTPPEQSKPRQRSGSEDLFSRVPSQRTSSEDTFTTARASPAPSIKSSSIPLIQSRNNSPQRRGSEAEKVLDLHTLQNAAEISIARQISISQRQRQLLVPTVPKVAPQPLQPRIVDVQEGSRRSRKSHRVVLEDA